MHVDGRLDAVAAQRLADQRTDGEIGHVVVVHHVEVDDVRTRLQHRPYLLAQAGEIGREYGGRNQRLAHEEISSSGEARTLTHRPAAKNRTPPRGRRLR